LRGSCNGRRAAYNDFTCNNLPTGAAGWVRQGPQPGRFGASMTQPRTTAVFGQGQPTASSRLPAITPELTGCPWHDVKAKLREVGLRPTRQRMALGWILFGKGDRHVTAEMLYDEATHAKVPVSLATVYNTLHQFTEVGLLRQVAVDGSKAYFDTNNSEHHHFFIEDQNDLMDIPTGDVVVGQAPVPPEGYEIARIDVVVRLRRKKK
jgi:Fur family transcriptional regulator, iron response regulator